METIIIKKDAIIEDSFCGKHKVVEDFEATVIDKQDTYCGDWYYVCLNDGKFKSGLEVPFGRIGIGQCFFVSESNTKII